jgi:hypothetical protein
VLVLVDRQWWRDYLDAATVGETRTADRASLDRIWLTMRWQMFMGCAWSATHGRLLRRGRSM